MATHPTRDQRNAADLLAEALGLAAEAVRLDGRARLDAVAFAALADLLARASSAFDRDAIVARTLERRARSLGLPAHLAELLTLMDSAVRPLDMLLLPDDQFRTLVATLEEQLADP